MDFFGFFLNVTKVPSGVIFYEEFISVISFYPAIISIVHISLLILVDFKHFRARKRVIRVEK